MNSIRRAAFLLMVAAITLAGCGGGTSARIGGAAGPSAQVSLLMTDTPPTGVSPLSFQVTLSSVTLNPGNVSVLSGPTTVEVTRLQTENALVDNHSVPVGTYTSATVTFSSPVMTFRNDSGSTVTVGGSTCLTGVVCTALSPALTNSAVTIPLAGSGISVTTNTPAALLLDLNLSNFLTNTSGTMAANAQVSGAVTLSSLAASQGALGEMAFGSMEDVVGVVGNVSSSAGTFTLQTALGTYALATSTGTSGTAFMNFPVAGSCAANFACVANGQIVSVNMDLLTNNTLLATRLDLEDANSSVGEIEGIVVGTNGTQFDMVVTQETPTVSGVAVGNDVTVSTQTALFDIDNLGASAGTSLYLFTGSQSLVVGQEVQVLAGSTGSVIGASRVRLRSSRISATVANAAFPQFTIGNGTAPTLPSFFFAAGTSQIAVTTRIAPTPNPYTELGGRATNGGQISPSPPNNLVSVRGQLFSTGSTPALIATKVILH